MAKLSFDDSDGVWRTVGGRKIFIRTGESLSSAMKNSGKFKSAKRKSEVKDESKSFSRYELKEKYGTDNTDLINAGKEKEDRVTLKEDKKEQNKYEGTKRWGFGYANDDNVPVYDGKIDYSGDFTHANLSNLTDNELREALNKQSELYKEASNRQVGDRRTYNGKKDEIFKKTDTLRYENGMKKINEEMEKRDLPRYNIYNKDNGQIMVSSPTKEMAERQLKEMYETDKSLQKSYNWEKTPKYEIREGKVDDNLNERKESNNWQEQIKANNAKMEKDVTNLQNKINEYRNRSINAKDGLEKYQLLKEADKLQNQYYERFRENERANAKIKVEEPNEKYMNIDAHAGYKEKFNNTWGDDGSSDKVVSAKMYTNDEFMEHLEDANWHSERKQLLEANLTNQELAYIKDKTKVSAWGVENLTGKEQVDKLIKEAKSQNNNISNSLRRKAYQKYLKEHPASEITFEDFKDMRK